MEQLTSAIQQTNRYFETLLFRFLNVLTLALIKKFKIIFE